MSPLELPKNKRTPTVSVMFMKPPSHENEKSETPKTQHENEKSETPKTQHENEKSETRKRQKVPTRSDAGSPHKEVKRIRDTVSLIRLRGPKPLQQRTLSIPNYKTT
jgi:hypothetical protein